MNNYSSIESLYVSKRRPRHIIISILTRNYQIILGVFLSIVMIVTVFPYEHIFTSIALIFYWGFILLKRLTVTSDVSLKKYNSRNFSLIRAIFIIISVTFYIYTINNVLANVTSLFPFDSLWLLLLVPTFVTSQRGDTTDLVLILIASLIGLAFITPNFGHALFKSNLIILNTLYISRAIWLTLLAFVLQTVSRYLGDYSADLGVIHSLQRELQIIENEAIDSPDAHEFQESAYLQKAVEKIAEDFNYPHVLIFFRESTEKIKIVAGSSDIGKELTKEEYILDVENSIVKHVMETGNSYVSNDVSRDEHYYSHPHFNKTRAELAIPLYEKTRLIGCIDIQADQKNIFLAQDIEVIEIIARYLSYAVHNSRMHKRREIINELVKSIATRFLTKQELFGTFQEITKIAHDELGADVSVFYGYDQDSGNINVPVSWGNMFNTSFESTYFDKECVVNKLFVATDKIYLHHNIEELKNDPLLAPSSHHIRNSIPSFIERENIKANVIIRLLDGKSCIGLLFVNYRTEQKFNEWDMEIILSLADLAELAIQKEQTYRKLIQNERETHAIEIHDPLVSNAWGIENLLSALIKSKNIDNKDEILIKQALESVGILKKDILWIQGTFNDNYSGSFSTEMNDILKRAIDIYGIEIEKIWYGAKQINNPNLSLNLLMILTESIGNAIRHGKADKIIVKVNVKDDTIEMEIIDDGRGFDMEKVKSEGGLRNMKRRIGSCGGSINVESDISLGTKIIVSAPIMN